jgi:hypothetical protein
MLEVNLALLDLVATVVLAPVTRVMMVLVVEQVVVVVVAMPEVMEMVMVVELVVAGSHR